MVGGGGGVSWEFTGLRKIRSDFTGLSTNSAAGENFTGIFVFLRPAEAKRSRYVVLVRANRTFPKYNY